jgi:peptidylamidoglycolate lyase
MMRRFTVVSLTVVFATIAYGASIDAQEPGPDPYMAVERWMDPFSPVGFAWGSNPGIFVESLERIFVVQRGEIALPDPLPAEFEDFVGSIGISALRATPVFHNSIFIVNSRGQLIETWTQWDHLFEGTNGPHKIRISPYDPERRVWVVNERRHQIHVFSNDGEELLMELGEAFVEGDDETHFGLPQDVAFLPDGSALVADGITNSRIVKFDAQGRFVTSWGSRGDGPSQLNGVHAVATDAAGRVYVADRNNDRVQVYNSNGNHLDTWDGLSFPNDVFVTADQDVWVADNQPPQMVKFDTNGNRLYSWMLDSGPHRFGEVHEMAVDAEGSWYGSDNLLGRTQKFVPRPGADPELLIGQSIQLSGPGR